MGWVNDVDCGVGPVAGTVGIVVPLLLLLLLVAVEETVALVLLVEFDDMVVFVV